jgi:tripartite-type tricarboxylate transporter receptor subunit TctC
LLVSVNPLVMNRSLYPNMTFDAVHDLTPVSLTSWGQLLLVTHPGTGYKSVADLLDAARKAPGKLNDGSPGVGRPHHLSMELFKNTSKTFLTHIPYRGTGPAMADLIGGQVEVMFLPIRVALPQVQAGRLLALAIGSEKRHALLPDVTTLSEAGGGNVNVGMWCGVFAPKGMAPAMVSNLNREINDIAGKRRCPQGVPEAGHGSKFDHPRGFLPPGRARRGALGTPDQGAEYSGELT